MYHIGVAVRLVGGSSYNEGRVEVNYNGEWGTVCDSFGWNFDIYGAGVVCRQLGFGLYGFSYPGYYYGRGSGPIWLHNIACIGNESTIASCGHLGFNITSGYCGHYDDAGVYCYGGQGMTLSLAMLFSFIQLPCHAISSYIPVVYILTMYTL